MPDPGLRARVGAWVTSPGVQRFIIALIVVNAVTLGLETSSVVMADYGDLLHVADRAILTVFVAEIAAKLFAFGWRFFRDPWNVFDFLVVGIALVPASGPLAVLRTLRVLRVLRLVSTVPRLRMVIEALLHAIPGIGAIAGLLLLIFYVGAVMATSLFAADFPDWFGHIGRSMFTLFQIMTLESWSMGIARPVMTEYPYAWAFFVPFILIATFTMLNLFIAVIVNTMQEMQAQQLAEGQDEIEATVHDDTARLLEELAALRAEVRALAERPAPVGQIEK
ncbi:MAG: ion transporter [Gammaproteobacteria bacterium]|jgi:voltage-gated sodium channel|nr:ion transporter [Gammaproteobacteria bacterium]